MQLSPVGGTLPRLGVRIWQKRYFTPESVCARAGQKRLVENIFNEYSRPIDIIRTVFCVLCTRKKKKKPIFFCCFVRVEK